VISRLLGVDEQDREKFGRWCDALVSVTAHTADEVRTAMIEIAGYLRAVVVAKREAPGADLISTWVAAQEEDDQLTDGEIVELAVAVLTAGHGATVNAIASGVRVLLAHPDRLAALRADRDSLGAVSEELLRYAMQSNLFRLMVAVEDLEVGGVCIRAGEAVIRCRSRRTSIRACLQSRAGSTPTVRTTRTSRSGTGRTSVWAPRWPSSNSTWR
jgi:cytochrome P450